MDHYVFEGRREMCWVISPKTVLHSKMAEKILCKRSHGRKNGVSAFYCPGPTVFLMLKKHSCTSYCTPKNNHAQPKGEKKISCPRKLPNPTPFQNIMVHS